jgi:hypothetical protein
LILSPQEIKVLSIEMDLAKKEVPINLKGLHYKSKMRGDFQLIPPNPYPVRALQRSTVVGN